MRTKYEVSGPRPVHCLLIEDEPDTARSIAHGRKVSRAVVRITLPRAAMSENLSKA